MSAQGRSSLFSGSTILENTRIFSVFQQQRESAVDIMTLHGWEVEISTFLSRWSVLKVDLRPVCVSSTWTLIDLFFIWMRGISSEKGPEGVLESFLWSMWNSNTGPTMHSSILLYKMSKSGMVRVDGAQNIAKDTTWHPQNHIWVCWLDVHSCSIAGLLKLCRLLNHTCNNIWVIDFLLVEELKRRTLLPSTLHALVPFLVLKNAANMLQIWAAPGIYPPLIKLGKCQFNFAGCHQKSFPDYL